MLFSSRLLGNVAANPPSIQQRDIACSCVVRLPTQPAQDIDALQPYNWCRATDNSQD